MQTVLITGANRGLGLGIARALVALPDVRVIVAARDLSQGRAVAAALGPRAEAVALDLSTLDAARRFADAWSEPLAGLVNNAGIQHNAGEHRTPDGYEETFAVNHLSAFLLTARLLPRLRGGRVLFIGSGTLNPDLPGPRRFGFRGARFTSVAALARGEADACADTLQQNRDRYATSKLANTVTAMELARRVPASHARFYTLDPGLMPGTGLARQAPWAQRLLWNTVMRWLAPWIPGASTPERSGATGAWMMTDPSLTDHNGAVYGADRAPSSTLWAGARDPALAAAVVDQSLEFLGERLTWS